MLLESATPSRSIRLTTAGHTIAGKPKFERIRLSLPEYHFIAHGYRSMRWSQNWKLCLAAAAQALGAAPEGDLAFARTSRQQEAAFR